MKRGDLVPDELTVAMIENRLAQPDAAEGFVLDGFPRNLAQAEALDAMLGGIGRGLDAILFFDIPDAVGMERALSRAELEGRADDTREVIAHRLEIYHRETEPIVEHYRTTGKLVPLHADRSIEQVWSRDRRRAPAGGARMIIRKSAAGDRDDGARRRGRRRDAGAARGAHPARDHDRRARRDRRGVHPLPRRRARPSRATRATRPRPACRRTRWSSTASRAR